MAPCHREETRVPQAQDAALARTAGRPLVASDDGGVGLAAAAVVIPAPSMAAL